MTTSPSYRLFVGIDIAARSFTADWRGDTRAPAPREWPQTVVGFTALQAQLAETGVPSTQTLVVLEATSSYWIRLAVTLHAAGYHVSVVNPKQIHHFSQSLPQRAKTDPLDAQVLSRFAAERQPPAWQPPPLLYHELHQRLLAREGLLEMRQQLRNQLHALAQQPVAVVSVHQHLHALVDELAARIAALEEEITRLLRDGAWAPSALLLVTIPGISWLTAAWLLVTTLNFTLCPSPEAAAAYAGLVPWQHESGSSVHKRAELRRGGNRRLRTALYQATLSAAQVNPVIRPFYERLRAKGKPHKVARCAAARKLLHLAWAVVTKQEPFDPAYAQRSHAQPA